MLICIHRFSRKGRPKGRIQSTTNVDPKAKTNAGPKVDSKAESKTEPKKKSKAEPDPKANTRQIPKQNPRQIQRQNPRQNPRQSPRQIQRQNPRQKPKQNPKQTPPPKNFRSAEIHHVIKPGGHPGCPGKTDPLVEQWWIKTSIRRTDMATCRLAAQTGAKPQQLTF